jgi:hypothetical protein
MGREKALLRIIGLFYFPVPILGKYLGGFIALLFYIPSVLRHLVTGKDPSGPKEKETTRRRLILWEDKYFTFIFTGEGEMPWKPPTEVETEQEN